MKKGDTIIEVLLAVTVFAMVMVGGIILMNSGTARTQASLQLTMARNAIDSQAEMLRYINSAYISNYPDGVSSNSAAQLWKKIKTVEQAKILSTCPNSKTGFSGMNAFVVYNNKVNNRLDISIDGKIEPATTFPRLVFNEDDTNQFANKNSFEKSEGLWVQAVKSKKSDYTDFHIRACWNTSGSSAPTTLGTIVRLYDPTK